MTNATGIAKAGEVIAAGLRVRLRMDDMGDPIFAHHRPGAVGTVERIDGAVAWVKWDGTRNAVSYLSGKLEVME